MDVIFLTDITGTIGEWLNEGFDDEVPVEAIKLLHEAYKLCVRELEGE